MTASCIASSCRATAAIEAHDGPTFWAASSRFQPWPGRTRRRTGRPASIAPTRRPRTQTKLTAVPYFAWDNREPGEMLVWLRGA